MPDIFCVQMALSILSNILLVCCEIQQAVRRLAMTTEIESH